MIKVKKMSFSYTKLREVVAHQRLGLPLLCPFCTIVRLKPFVAGDRLPFHDVCKGTTSHRLEYH